MDIAEILKNAANEAKNIVAEIDNKEDDDNLIEEKDTHPLDNLTDEEVVKQVDELQRNRHVLEQENNLLIRFFQRTDPSAIEAMGQILKTAQNIQTKVGTIDRKRSNISNRMSKKFSTIFSEGTEFFSTMSSANTERNFPKVNITQRSDLVYHEIEAIQNEMALFNKRAHRREFNLKADIEELELRESDIKKTIENFEKLKQSYDNQAIPLIKYIRFMDETHRASGLACDKIRLHSSWYKIQYQKISNIYSQKLLIGENLQEVDFEQLRIENLHLVNKINQKNLLLLEMKTMNGKANLLLSQHKQALMKKIDTLNSIIEEKRRQEQNLIKIDEDIRKAAIELSQVKEEYDRTELEVKTYRAPDVMQYVRKKAELSQLQKELNMWSKRRDLKLVSLELSLIELNRVNKKARPKVISS